jgi:hypothetical protein
LREERPAADERPTLNVRIRVIDAHDFGGCVLRRLDVVEDADDLHSRVLGRFVFRALHPVLEVRCVLIAGEDGHFALAAHQRRQLGHRLLARLVVVHAVVGEALRLRRVAVEGHHRNASGSTAIVDRAGPTFAGRRSTR